MRTIRTTCPYCGVGCGIAATVNGTRSIAVAGDKQHPANQGALCSKGTHLGETVALEGRLLTPMIGDAEASWDTVLDEVADRMRETIDKHGPDSVAFYVSGQLLTEDYYVANKLAKGFVGTGNIDTNSRLCMASAVAAHQRAFGEDIVPCSYSDLDAADLILLVGSNAAWCHPVVWQRIERARSRRGTKLVVIDPRRTETAEQADLHIPLAPDGDISLFNALLVEMRERGLVDDGRLAAGVDVPAGFWESLGAACPGVPHALFTALADLVADNPRMVTLFSQGANQSVCGTDKGNAIINLHLALDRIGRHGSGPFSITGQPNAMGGREVGGLATMLACHLGFSEEERADVAAFWQTGSLCTGPGLKAVEMFRAAHDGRIKFLWIMATNPAVSMPDAGFVQEALKRCPTVVVSDVIADTDTARLADIRLPALAWGEKDGTVTNSERCVSRQRALFAPPGEARADWRIVRDVAWRLGYQEQFAFESAAGVFREYAAMTALSLRHGKLLDLTNWSQCSALEYETMRPFQWGGEHPIVGRAATGSAKPRMVAVVDTPPIEQASRRMTMRLNTGRYRDQWHTMTRTGLSPKLSIHRREPLLEIHPDDAAISGLSDKELARVSTTQGEAVFRVALSTAQRRGEIFAPMHWSEAMGAGGWTGRLVHSLTDPLSGQPGFKNIPASVEPVEPDWRAFLVSREPARPDALYWVRTRVEGGWLTEMAGQGSVDLDALLPSGERSEVRDIARGMRRVAVRNSAGTVLAALFLTRTGVLPEREWVVGRLGETAVDLGELLGGRPAKAQPNRGPIVCVCCDVGEQQILAAAADGAETVEALGACTRAGTNCGSCRPLIARILQEIRFDLEHAAQ